MFVKIRNFSLILSYIVIIFYISTVKLQISTSVSPNTNTSASTNQCAKVNQTIALGKEVPDCYCDLKCNEYRDCCRSVALPGNLGKPFQNCTSFANGDFYVKRFCPADVTNDTLKNKCAKNYTFVNRKFLKNLVPVTSKAGLSFGNKFCASCHNISDFQLWNINVTCGNYSDLVFFDNSSNPFLNFSRNLIVGRQFRYYNSTKTWQIQLGGVKRNCTLRPAIPDNLKPMGRPCIPNIINTCPWPNNFTNKCAAYQSIYRDTNRSRIYRNLACKRCWITGNRTTSTTTNTPSTTSASPRPTRPRPIWPTPKPSAVVHQVIGRSYLRISIPDENYAETLSRINLTKLQTETRYYKNISRTYVRNVTHIRGSQIKTCNISAISKAEDSNQIPIIVPIACNIVLLLGSAFLGLSIRHLVTSQYNNYLYRYVMTSFTISLLLSNGGWFFKNIVNNCVDNLFEPFDHVVNYFAFLTSLLSLTTMAFHISCTSWKAYYQFSTIKNDQSKSLYLYSIVNWFLPALATMLENSNLNAIPQLNVNSNLHLLLFFTFPFVVAFSANLSFFTNSAVLVATEKVVEQNLQKLEINFKFFSALLGITHLMWLVALLFCYSRSYALIVLFYVLNIIVCLLVYCVANGSKIFANESVQFFGDKSSLVIVNKAE